MSRLLTVSFIAPLELLLPPRSLFKLFLRLSEWDHLRFFELKWRRESSIKQLANTVPLSNFLRLTRVNRPMPSLGCSKYQRIAESVCVCACVCVWKARKDPRGSRWVAPGRLRAPPSPRAPSPRGWPLRAAPRLALWRGPPTSLRGSLCRYTLGAHSPVLFSGV